MTRSPWGFAAVMVIALLGLIATTLPASADEAIKLRIGTIAPEGTVWADRLTAVKQAIQAESNGRIKVILYFGGRRGDEAEMMKQLRRHKLEGAGLSIGEVAAEIPAFRVLELPFLFETVLEVDQVIARPDIGGELERRAQASGIKLAVWSENGWRHVATKTREIKTIADLAGLRVRAQDTPTNLELWRCLGADPVPIPLDEVLVALQAGVIDGFDQTPIYTVTAGWHTQVSHFVLTQHSYQAAVVIYDQAFLEGLDDDLAELVLRITHREAKDSREAVRKVNEELLAELARTVHVVKLDPAERAKMRERVAPVYESFRRTTDKDLLERVLAALALLRAEPSKE